METKKAFKRRLAEGYFQKFCNGRGIDIGAGPDPLVIPPGVNGTVEPFDQDLGHGDATYMAGIEDWSFDFVHSSHCLEHLVFPVDGLQNWWRILKSGGYLLINIPNRDRYEKQRRLPSRWNGDHKTMWKLNTFDPPNTFGIVPLIKQVLPDAQIIYARELDMDKEETPNDSHGYTEYSIEVVLRKPLTETAGS